MRNKVCAFCKQIKELDFKQHEHLCNNCFEWWCPQKYTRKKIRKIRIISIAEDNEGGRSLFRIPWYDE